MARTATDAINRAATFHPQTTPDEKPAVRLGKILVFTYLDEDGGLRVSVDLDETTRPTTPVRLDIQGERVYTTG